MRRARTGLRLALPIALMLAIGLRFLCPPGWMPNPTGVAPPFVLCPGEGDMPAVSGGMSMPMHRHGDQPQPAHGKGHQDHCVPGAWVMGAPAEAPGVGVPVAFEYVALADEARPSPSSPPARHRPQAPRAPPLFA